MAAAQKTVELVIFDCDGVLVDSEMLSGRKCHLSMFLERCGRRP